MRKHQLELKKKLSGLKGHPQDSIVLFETGKLDSRKIEILAHSLRPLQLTFDHFLLKGFQQKKDIYAVKLFGNPYLSVVMVQPLDPQTKQTLKEMAVAN